jgi:DNA-binding response OmpR family regulator
MLDRLHLLVVEDDCKMLRTLCMLLRSEFFKVSVRQTGQQAIGLVLNNNVAACPVDFVIADCNLSDYPGRDLEREFYFLNLKTPIIMTRSYNEKMLLVELLARQNQSHIFVSKSQRITQLQLALTDGDYRANLLGGGHEIKEAHKNRDWGKKMARVSYSDIKWHMDSICHNSVITTYD